LGTTSRRTLRYSLLLTLLVTRVAVVRKMWVHRDPLLGLRYSPRLLIRSTFRKIGGAMQRSATERYEFSEELTGTHEASVLV